MQRSGLARIAAVVSVVGVLSFVGHHQQTPQLQASCQHQISFDVNGQEILTLQCQAVPQTSWLNWVKGKSFSAQFHFIDLLELLNRMHSGHDSK